jgi:lipoprotein
MKNRIKKFGGIIAILLVTVACSNSSTSAVAPEKRESFAENIMVKLFKQYGVYSFEQPKEYFEKNEFQTFEELLDNEVPNWRKRLEEEWFKNEKEATLKVIKEAEEMTKSKFFVQRGKYNEPKYIFFTPKENIGCDLCKIYVTSGFLLTNIIKISIKDYVKEYSLYYLKSNMRDSVDIKSLGLDKETTDKLLEAQNNNQ